MKVLFIEARKNQKLEKQETIFPAEFKKFKTIGLVASLQYLDMLEDVKRALKKQGKKIFLSKSKMLKYSSQILGCDINAALNIEKKVQAFLLLSSGRFHAIQIAIATSKPVFIFSGNTLSMIEDKEIQELRKKRKTALLKFLSADKIGILTTIKPGQQKFAEALKIKKKIEKKGKKAFIFISDTINQQEMENFQADAWLSTVCPTFAINFNNVVNYWEIEKFI